VVLEALQRRSDAEREYLRALERDAEHVPSLLNLASLCADAGRDQEAKEFCRRALALSLPVEEERRLRRYVEAGR
jgi:tetratricopeptide (TPR) repeat protein